MNNTTITPELQQLHQDEFVAALRSGEYTQIPGMRKDLCRPQHHCVLGVADVLRDETGYASYNHDKDLCTWLGISRPLMMQLMTFSNGGESGQLYFGEGHKTFPEIADWFKEQRNAYHGDLTHWDGDRSE